MSSESKQSSPIGDVVFEKEFSNWYFDIKNGTGFTPSVSEIIYFFKQRIAGSQWASSAHPTAVNGDYRGCPCKYLDEPCHPRCTCVNGASSTGCMFCATYGSLEQRKAAAERIAEKLRPKAAAPQADVKSKEEDEAWWDAESLRLSFIAVPNNNKFSDRDRHTWQDGFLSAISKIKSGEYANQFKK